MLHACPCGVIEHAENILVQERFAPIVHAQMLKAGGIVDHFFKQVEIHETFFTVHALGHKTKRATQVAGVGRFDDERRQFFYFHHSITFSTM